MKTNKKTIIIAASALVVGLLLGWLIFGRQSVNTENEHQHAQAEVGETIWTCSMHPQIRQNELGNCPICGMELIPLGSGNEDEMDPMAVSMSPTAMQLASVRTAQVGEIVPVKEIRLNGKIQEDERLVYSQSSHIPGRIEKLEVNFTGEYIRKGQVIAYIYSPELVTAQEELFEAEKIKETQPGLFESAKEKLKNWKLTEQQIDRILTKKQTQENFAITADVAGYVINKKVNLGDYLKRGESIYEVADLSKVWVLFDVYESDLVWINKGDEVSFTVQSLPGQKFDGKITFLDPVIDPRTRVAKARVEIRNKSKLLKPEMFVSGTLKATLKSQTEGAIVVPKSAVMWTGKRSVVYIKTSSNKGVNFIMREVTLGPALGESFIIEEGLREGEEIAVNGTFSIDAAAQLAGKPSMMNPEGGVVMTGHNHGGDVPEATKPVKKILTSVQVSKKAKEALRPLYVDYMTFKDHLVADNLAEAKIAASKMKMTLEKINMAVFTGQSHNTWMDYSSNLKNALQHIEHYKTIEEIREVFKTISNAMVEMTQVFKPLEKEIYVQHCPMANSNKGADWLSLDEEIQNPYFGEAMLKCGEVTQKIK